MRLTTEDSLCLVIDVQERLMPAMDESQPTLDRIHRLIDGLTILGLPFLISEQYPKGLGPTVASVKTRLAGSPTLAKVSFSCCDDPALLEALLASGRKNILVCGVEAHVCVQQTVVDLAALEFRPVVIADAVTSRNPDDVGRALDRMGDEGAIITGVESVLFELTRTAGTDTFKAISRLVK
jgi:hypothetical protein